MTVKQMLEILQNLHPSQRIRLEDNYSASGYRYDFQMVLDECCGECGENMITIQAEK